MRYPAKLSPDFVRKFERLVPPWGPVGYVTYKRTYARLRDDLGRKEEWYETCTRCVDSILEKGCRLTKDEAERLYQHMFFLRCNMSGRALWQLGTRTVDKIGSDSLQNCWCVAVNHYSKPFTFMFNQLMLGGGVGFNITPECVYEIPPVRHFVSVSREDTADVDFIVPDNREGWVELLDRILTAFYVTGKHLRYATMCIRERGRAIQSFGGIASGSEELVSGLAKITNILQGAYGRKLNPIDCLDIANIIGSIVVAGNVRRSAELALGNVRDHLFLAAKDWTKGSFPVWRGMSNNSCVANSYDDLTDDFWRGYNGDGEPYGLVNLRNCREFGRTSEPRTRGRDPNVIGVNPCGEITLENGEPCNLGEIYLPNCTKEAFQDCAYLLYKVLKTISCIPFSDPMTQAVVDRNHRLGLGITGICSVDEVPYNWMKDAYGNLLRWDEEYSKELGVTVSNKYTCIKPSGTLSLLPGVAPGLHGEWDKHYNRLIRFAANDPLVPMLQDHGYYIEPLLNQDGSRDYNTMVCYFPIKARGKRTAQSMTAIDQLKLHDSMQECWADNSVSCTVTYSKEELPAIKEYMKMHYDDRIKTISFLLRSNHGFVQAPLQSLTEQQYNEYSESLEPLTHSEEEEDFEIFLKECEGGACPVR